MEELWKEKLLEKTIQRLNYFKDLKEKENIPKVIEEEKFDQPLPFFSFSTFESGFKIFCGVSSIILMIYVINNFLKKKRNMITLDFTPFPLNNLEFPNSEKESQSKFVEKSVKMINLKKFSVKDIENPFIQSVELRNETLFD